MTIMQMKENTLNHTSVLLLHIKYWLQGIDMHMNTAKQMLKIQNKIDGFHRIVNF